MNINNPFDILKSAQKFQENYGAIQDKLADIQVTGSAGGGMVEVDYNGKLEVLAVRIDPEIFDAGDRELIQGLIVSACSDAQAKAREILGREIGSLARMIGSAGFPGSSS
jgi:DNA-binding YbaB/EbfC family protein